jgi:mannose-6-phosphate isomerase-like protein (cupin superfamily)
MRYLPLLLLLATAPAPKTPTVLRAADVKFALVPNSQIEASDLWGDSKKGAHGSLAKFPGSFIEPLHTHTNEIRVVVVKGEMEYTIGDNMTKVGPGSFVKVPGGVKHFAKCADAGGCLIFLEQDGKMDMKTP